MSAVETHGQRLSLAARRFQFWDRESRIRRLEPWESEELDRAQREVDWGRNRDLVRAQAPPPERRRGTR